MLQRAVRDWRCAHMIVPPRKGFSLSGRLVIAAIIVLIVCLVAGSWFFPDYVDTAAWMVWIGDLGMWAAPMLILLMIAHNVMPLPAELIALCAGAILGTVMGTLVVWTGAMLGAALAFWVARRFGRALAARHISAEQLGKVDRVLETHGAAGLLFVRLMPFIAFNLVNYAAGLTSVSWPVFLWTTALGILPLTILTAYAGANMTELSLPTIFALCGLAILGLAINVWVKSRRD